MLTEQQTLDTWLADHAYLSDLARFERLVSDEACAEKTTGFTLPSQEALTDDFSKGLPLLRCGALDPALVSAAAASLSRLAVGLSAADAPEKTRAACALLHDELGRQPDASEKLITAVLSGDEPGSRSGLIRYLCWKALRPLLGQWSRTAGELNRTVVWGRPYCPVCGSLPAMGQLAHTKQGRARLLSCGCCGSRWSFSRTTCPFCENQDQDRLRILEAEQEEMFRVDVCGACNGYLKTYLNEGDEALFLADWSTLHLDVLARNKGLLRKAASLYEL
jgi:FdhE protein